MLLSKNRVALPLLASALVFAGGASAQTTDIDAFKAAKDEAKVHVSGFVCPLFIGHFERDAFGERSPSRKSDFCAYAARDGVYGTITLTPLTGAYDAKIALASEFTEQEGIGGKLIGEKTLSIGPREMPISVYTRTYETAALETLHYRILFSGAAVGNWELEATVEFATPRDDENQREFLNTVFTEALTHIAKIAPPQGPLMPAVGTTITSPPPLPQASVGGRPAPR
jgi:hypothetical protein